MCVDLDVGRQRQREVAPGTGEIEIDRLPGLTPGNAQYVLVSKKSMCAHENGACGEYTVVSQARQHPEVLGNDRVAPQRRSGIRQLAQMRLLRRHLVVARCFDQCERSHIVSAMFGSRKYQNIR